jgi:hypothetical protein
MDGFTKLPKMQCFKEGGSIQPENKHPKKVKEQKGVPAVSKKDAGTKAPFAFGLKGTTPDVEDESTPAMKKGGRAKKAMGTVKKYKTGGSVTNVYEAKKSSGDIDNIRKTKDIKPTKAAAPSKAATKPAFKGSDVAKEKSKPSGDAVALIKSKQSGKSAAAPSGAKGGPNKYKCGGGVKKYDDGGSVFSSLRDKIMGTPAQNAIARQQEAKYLRAKQLQRAAGQPMGMGEQMATGLASMGQQMQPANPMAGQGSVSDIERRNAALQQGATPAQAAPMPAQKKGGKVKGKC